jgi:cytochrome b
MTEANTQPRLSRWDPVVKLTHWSVVLAVLANAVVTEEGSAAHIWVGYALAAILGLRLLWGLIGPAEARFSAFLPSPRRALAHLREIRSGTVTEHRSHNPLGALMVYAIWSCLLVIIGTGIAMAGLPDTNGQLREPEAAYASAEAYEEAEEREGGEHEEGAVTEVHEVAANLLYLLILLHIAGVVFETRRSGRKVVLAMVPGHR